MENIEVLSPDCYLGKLADVGDGRSAYTHIAKIRYMGEKMSFHVKLFNSHKQLSNEITAYILARLNEQPVPEHACIIKLSKDDIATAFPDVRFNSDAYGWATTSIEGKTPNSYFDEGTKEGQLALQVLKKIEGIASLIAFDDLIANQDRNLGNIMLSSDHAKFWIFDHDQAPFSSEWKADELKPNRESVCKLSMALFPAGIPQSTKSLIAEASKIHNKNSTILLNYLTEWWDLLVTNDESKALGEFFSTRSDISEGRILKKMGLLC